MERALKIVESSKLASIVCVFHQVIYSKASEIKWKEKQNPNGCVLMIGMFHMLMLLMHILSKRFWVARFRDVLIQSSVIVGGSGDKTLSGKMYNTGVRLYKLAYESFIRKLFNALC